MSAVRSLPGFVSSAGEGDENRTPPRECVPVVLNGLVQADTR